MRLTKFPFPALSLLLLGTLSVSCGGGGAGSTPPPATPISGTPDNVAVTVSPATATLSPNGGQQYTATVTGTTNTATTWSAGGVQGGNSGFGTISATGQYMAPAALPNPPSVIIRAVSAADTTKSGTAVAIVNDNVGAQNPPIKLGTSGGNRNDQTTDNTTHKISCCSGTLGALVSRGGTFYILSNNHVLDRSDVGSPGDPITQPGLAESNCGQNPVPKVVANMSQAVALNATNNVDAAIAAVIPSFVDQSGSILDLAGIGQAAPPSAVLATAGIGQPVVKSGATTGLTCSTVLSTNTRVSVDYSTQCGAGGTKFTVAFNNQVVVNGGQFSASGDSGSLIVASDSARPVALLYAGSGSTSVGNPIQEVLTALRDPTTNEVPVIVGGADHPIACPAAAQGVQSQVTTQQAITTTPRLSSDEVSRARVVKNRRADELMRDPAITGVGVGQSDDNPAESAIVVFTKDRTRVPIPAQIDGVRTKVVAGSAFHAQQSIAGQKIAALPAIADDQLIRARASKELHADELMSNRAILGVGVGASSDNPAEAAVVVFVEQGKSASVPAEIDGVRTRVITTDPFRTYEWGKTTVTSCSRK